MVPQPVRPASPAAIQRCFPIGCEIVPGGAHFRVWAPAAKKVDVVIQGGANFSLTPENGYFAGFTPVAAGARYRFSLGDPTESFPDPASRYQPDGPFGWSQIVDPQFRWTDAEWQGVQLKGQILYEMHIGTFTREGTWNAAAVQLPELAAAGITVLEIMPVADFAGRFGWGYDGVNLFAPCRLYGTPDDFRRFVDQAHSQGLGVILDVVYNHVGPSGNFLGRFAPQYFHSSEKTDWGDAINFDGPDSPPVREFFVTNARYWIEEFHLDGLRLDATQNIYDTSNPHILREIGEAVRTGAHGRNTIVVAENEPQDSRLIRSVEQGGYELSGMWNDDFHHSAVVALTGRREAYYTDYDGRSQELLSAIKHGFLFQGQHYSWQKQNRGTSSLDVAPHSFVTFLENHDQVANSAQGLRLHQLTSPGRWRAMTVLLLLTPGTPMLFQGQEFDSTAPFLFFADHEGDLGIAVSKGRVEFLSQFASIAADSSGVADPCDASTYERCKLDFSDRDRNRTAYALHKDLLQLRRNDPVLSRSQGLDGAVLTDRAFLIRFFGENENDRLLLVNLDGDYAPASISEPLLAPPNGHEWQLTLSSENTRYGGGGAYNPCNGGKWNIPGEAAVLLSSHTLSSQTLSSHTKA